MSNPQEEPEEAQDAPEEESEQGNYCEQDYPECIDLYDMGYD